VVTGLAPLDDLGRQHLKAQRSCTRSRTVPGDEACYPLGHPRLHLLERAAATYLAPSLVDAMDI
jgi:hypothetical protein